MIDPFEEYLERFCEEHGLTQDEAKRLKIVQIIEESYRNDNKIRSK